MIKAIIFDLDNTLIDLEKFKNKCVNSAIDSMISAGLKIKKEKANKIIWDILFKIGWEHKHVFQDFLKKVNGKVDPRLLARAIISYRKTRADLMTPYPGVIKTLKELKRKYKIAIISDAPRLKAWQRLVLIEADDLFEFVITFDDTNRKKPHKLPFQKAIRKLKLKPQNMIIVGDRIKSDMIGGKRAGMKTCLALYGMNSIPKKKPESADFMIKNIREIKEIIKQN